MKDVNEPARPVAADRASPSRNPVRIPASVTDDAEIYALVARGDHRAALVALMRAYGDIVYSHCVRFLRDRVLAQDVHQQIFLEAFRDLARFRGQSSFRTWLIGIAGHRCLDAVKAYRRRARRIGGGMDKETVANLTDPSPHSDERLDQVRLARALEDCLQKLPDEVRLAVLMRFQARMSYEEMSSACSAKAGTLQARVSRALPALRRCLDHRGVTP
jgi:RNA polymerase sigma-70 factor (ECF subfamily)